MSTQTQTTRQWIMVGFLFTIPTFLFWIAVVGSRFSFFDALADRFLFYGMVTYIGFTFILPTIGLLIGIFTRMRIIEQESKTRIYSEQTNNMKLNQRLINWCVLLYTLLVVALLVT